LVAAGAEAGTASTTAAVAAATNVHAQP